MFLPFALRISAENFAISHNYTTDYKYFIFAVTNFMGFVFSLVESHIYSPVVYLTNIIFLA